MQAAFYRDGNNRDVDPATGFFDRSGGFDLLGELVASLPGDSLLAMIWIDLDRFRQVNESFGHNGGDSVIAQIALRLRSVAHDRAEWCRMAGDEFLCLVACEDAEQAGQLAIALLRVIEEPLPFGGMLLHPSASVGVALLEEGEDTFSCLERADRAMSSAKRAGGARVVISGEEKVPGRLGILLAREELELENQIHLALENGGLCLHYQPIVGLDGRVNAVEALMRCATANGSIPPGKFIPVAEKTGLIVRLGEWSLLAGTRFAQRLDQAGLRTRVAINVSRAQLASPHFSQALHAAFLCADIDPKLIELELTESLFMDISEVVRANLRTARDLGLALAIDDFGTGYSCLANLKDIPATKIKLDRAFVTVLPHDRRAFSVVKAMTQLGTELGMEVVAEGIEELAQLEALREAGVHSIQGYFYSPPMPEDELLQWLRDRRGM
jgi:diguanylate cyclase (GGDEF)-like protein